MAKDWYGWAVYWPSGDILLWTIATTRDRAIRYARSSKAGGDKTWRQLYRAGWRVRAIRIEAEQREGGR